MPPGNQRGSQRVLNDLQATLKRRVDNRIVRTALILAAIYLCLLLTLTFLPLGDPEGARASALNLVPFKTINHALRGGAGTQGFLIALGNLAAFVPVGLIVPLLVRRWQALAVLGSALVLSVGIELGQYAISRAIGFPYRSADIDDVILNVTGAIVGYAAFVIVGLIGRRSVEA
jgi:glycopeptide antibiotics resistance protein